MPGVGYWQKTGGSKSSSSGSTNVYGGSAGKTQAGRTIEVKLNVNGKSASEQYSESEADALVKVLEQAQRASRV